MACRPVLLGLLALFLAVSLACHPRARSTDELTAGPAAKRYPFAGRVVSVDRGEAKVTVAHQKVEGLMDAMTMAFQVKERWALGTMAPGDRLTATLVVDGARSWLEGVVVTRGSGAEGGATVPGGPPAGAALPDVALVDEVGRRVTRADFTGRISLVTFIYTRCPLPDYCPLMMQRFKEIAKALDGQPNAPASQLVAVTVDPEHDTAQVLRRYALAQVPATDGGANSPDQRRVRWRFLTGKPRDVRTFAKFFGLEYSADGGEIMHALRTAVIDERGRVVSVLRGNDWTADEVLDAIRL